MFKIHNIIHNTISIIVKYIMLTIFLTTITFKIAKITHRTKAQTTSKIAAGLMVCRP